MKPSDIQVGKTYCNRGKGRTTRKVLGIGNEYRPKRYFNAYDTPPNEPGVQYEQSASETEMVQRCLYLSSFASWAGKEVK